MSKIDYRLIKKLYLFLVVAEEEHFGRAAKRLGMSQPPLTEQIKVLEQSLNLNLFERSRRGTKLSSAGKAILPLVKNFVDHMSSLEHRVKEVANGQSGILRIGSITAAMTEVVPALIAHFKDVFPTVTIFVNEIDSADAVDSLSTGKLDLVFVRVEGDQNSQLQSLALSKDRLGIAIPTHHKLASLSEVNLGDLRNETFVMSSRQVNPVYFDFLTESCRRSGFNPRILYEVRSIAAQIAYVSCGQGIALVPISMEDMIPNNVTLLPLEGPILVVSAAMMWNPDQSNPMVDYAVKWMMESFRK